MTRTRKRKALARSPIDAVITPPPSAHGSGTSAEAPTPLVHQERRSAKRVAHTFRIDPELLAQCRSAVVALSGPPLRLTLSGLVEDALRRELRRLQRQHNAGDEFPDFDGNLRPGRPIGS